VGEDTYSVTVVQSDRARVQLEVAGEPATVEGWPEGSPEPLASLSVNGEKARLESLVREALSVAKPTTAATPAPLAGAESGRPPGAPSPGSATSVTPAQAAGEGIAVVPPMPGKIVEVRVREGERVRAGQVLLVLEAMKMRNEVPSPATGRVAGLKVKPGSSASAREPMLRIVPE
jgi:biotin carboxyl carrier protein